MPLTLLDQISAKSPELTKSERKIALAVLDDPALTATENIAQLARRAGVSEPTVYRFCRTFGTDGFPAFKLALTSELSREGSGPRESVKPGDSVDDVTRKVISGASSALKELSRSLEPAILARCIDLISQSRRIVIAAEGLSQPAGVWLQVRLIRLGIPCELSTDAALGTLRAASLRPGELIIAISSTGQSRIAIACVTAARAGGAWVITVCPDGSDLAALDCLQLSCPRAGTGVQDLMCTRFALMPLMQILIAGVSLRHADSVWDLQPRLDKAQSELYLPTAAQLQEQAAAQAEPAAAQTAVNSADQDKLKASQPIQPIKPGDPVYWKYD